MALQATYMAILATAFLLFSLFCSSTLSTSHSSIPVGAGKVNVNFYYESLCQSCRNFITGDLQHLLDKNLGSIINLRLIPWGNARISNGNFVCQFGPDECYLNTVQACAIHIWPDLRTHLDFIQCSENAYKDWTSCVTSETAHELQQCAASNLGKNLGLAFAYETQNLNPPHEFVPWATVNDLPLRKDIFNIMKYICDAYQGPNPPSACNTRTLDGNEEYGSYKSELKTCMKG